jgi:dihydrolipoamide dehydrogenase
VKTCDVLVIGAGPGGYPAAIRSAQLGKKVIIVDKGNIGGECLNWGCIPSKALISAANIFHKVKHDIAKMGIIGGKDVSINFKKMQRWKESIQRRLINGIKRLLTYHGVEQVIGTAKLLSDNQCEVSFPDGTNEIIQFENTILATGAQFISLPGFEINEIDVLSAKGALELKEIPRSIAVIGGGIIGLELGTVYAKLGSKITVIELLPNLMTGIDDDLVKIVRKKLRSYEVDIFTEARATNIERINNELVLSVDSSDGQLKIVCDKVLLSVGKKALTGNIGLDHIGIITDRNGFIQVDEYQRTNIKGIYAIGDCTGMPFLAHRATRQGIIAAEVIAGIEARYDPSILPSAVFTDPEIAFVGMSKGDCEGMNVSISSVPFGLSGRAMSQLETDGFIQIIADEHQKILGVQIVGPHASDLISEASLALSQRMTLGDVTHTIHPHPTFPETFLEAAEDLLNKSIHYIKEE